LLLLGGSRASIACEVPVCFVEPEGSVFRVCFAREVRTYDIRGELLNQTDEGHCTNSRRPPRPDYVKVDEPQVIGGSRSITMEYETSSPIQFFDVKEGRSLNGRDVKVTHYQDRFYAMYWPKGHPLGRPLIFKIFMDPEVPYDQGLMFLVNGESGPHMEDLAELYPEVECVAVPGDFQDCDQVIGGMAGSTGLLLFGITDGDVHFWMLDDANGHLTNIRIPAYSNWCIGFALSLPLMNSDGTVILSWIGFSPMLEPLRMIKPNLFDGKLRKLGRLVLTKWDTRREIVSHKVLETSIDAHSIPGVAQIGDQVMVAFTGARFGTSGLEVTVVGLSKTFGD